MSTVLAYIIVGIVMVLMAAITVFAIFVKTPHEYEELENEKGE